MTLSFRPMGFEAIFRAILKLVVKRVTRGLDKRGRGCYTIAMRTKSEVKPTTAAEQRVIAWVMAWQVKKRLRDQDVAETLGISRVYWHGLRTGRVRLGEYAMRGVAKAFPKRFRKDLIRILEGDEEEAAG